MSEFPQPDAAYAEAARQRQSRLAKPPGSLGRLEAAAVELAALQRRHEPAVDTAHIAVFAADHGIATAGVSAFPPSVTVEMVRNFATGGAAVSVLCGALGAVLEVVDVGTALEYTLPVGVRQARAGWGTADFRHAPAMTPQQFQVAWEEGEAAANRAAENAAELFIGGDMGIGNTTAAAAVGAALLELPAGDLVGKGTGVDAAGLLRKTTALEEGLARYRSRPERDGESALRELGGFEMVALAGAYTAAARARLPVLVDGFIATAAALAAVRCEPRLRPWLLFAHRSAEAGHARLLDALGAEPLLSLGMRLGEGSGAAVALPVLRLACRLHAQMATFDEAGVSSNG